MKSKISESDNMKKRIIIDIETSKMKKWAPDGEDISEEQEKEWHDTIYSYLSDECFGEDFERNLFNYWIHSSDFLNPKAKTFSDLGALTLGFTHEDIHEIKTKRE